METLKTLAILEIILGFIVGGIPFILYYYDVHYGYAFLYSPYGWYIWDVFLAECTLGIIILSLGFLKLRRKEL